MIKTNRGITLIALIITIIVLLILAGITLSMVMGSDGIIKKATEAVEVHNESSKKELEQLDEVSVYLDNYGNYGTCENALYIWNYTSSAINDLVNYSRLKSEVDYLGTDTIYACLSDYSFLDDSSSNKYQVDKMSNFCNLYNIDFYLLDGSAEMTEEQIKSKIDSIYNYNQNTQYKIKGINMDIEFYLSDEYQEADTNNDLNTKISLIEDYIDLTNTCANYAHSKNLEYVICLPIWLDGVDEDSLENITKSNCDRIAYMNYNSEGDYSKTNIEKEVEFAKKYNKEISSIAELQNIDPETITFYDEGIETCIANLDSIQKEYNYSKLGRAYHCYSPIKDLIKDKTDIENRYELELVVYDENGDRVNIKSAYIKSSDGEKITAIPVKLWGYAYTLDFCGLECGKTYTMVITDNDYKNNKYSLGSVQAVGGITNKTEICVNSTTNNFYSVDITILDKE